VSTVKVSMTEARERFSQLLAAVERDGEHVTVARHDAPVAAIVPIGWYRQVQAGGDPLTKENPVLPFAGEVRFTVSADLAFRLVGEVFRRTGDRREDRTEALNAIVAEAVSRYLDEAESSGPAPQDTTETAPAAEGD
jgi:prevent-host-death family protein